MTSANLHIENLKEKLLALKEGNGEFLDEFLTSFNESNKFRHISIWQATGDETKFLQIKSQFFQALHDNIVHRFPCDDLLKMLLLTE